jgi:hypothetical protein
MKLNQVTWNQIRDEWDQERSDSLRYPKSNKFLIIIIILSNREASTTAGQIWLSKAIQNHQGNLTNAWTLIGPH